MKLSIEIFKSKNSNNTKVSEDRKPRFELTKVGFFKMSHIQMGQRNSKLFR